MQPHVAPEIVMVDDNPEVLDLAERYFSRKGLSILRSDTPFGVTTLVMRHRPAAVVLDVMMPALGGPELAKLLGENSELTGLPIIFYSAIPPSQGSDLVRRFPNSRFVPKAEGVRVLYDAVTQAIGMPGG